MKKCSISNFRRLESAIAQTKEEVIPDPNEVREGYCHSCKVRVAAWTYMPAKRGEPADFCEECVPRGCSCNVDEDGKENLDAKGRRLPCCEYWEV